MLSLLNLAMRLRTLKKTKNTLKEGLKKGYKDINSQCKKLQLFNTLPEKLNAIKT